MDTNEPATAVGTQEEARAPTLAGHYHLGALLGSGGMVSALALGASAFMRATGASPRAKTAQVKSQPTPAPHTALLAAYAHQRPASRAHRAHLAAPGETAGRLVHTRRRGEPKSLLLPEAEWK